MIADIITRLNTTETIIGATGQGIGAGAPGTGDIAERSQALAGTIGAGVIGATAASSNTIDVGMNLAPVNYYGTQFPFLDRFKTSREWAAQGSSYQALDGPIALDANGYPQAMPAGAINLYTIVSLDPVSLAMPDVYVLTYKGTANISIGSATILSSEPGRIVFRFTGEGSATPISISSIDPANPLTAIHVVRQDQVALYDSGEIFNPAFLDKASQWSELRYMDWGNTNNSTLQSWDRRVTVDSASWGSNNSAAGVPIEIMVALANKTQTDMWINIPAEADDSYVRNTLAYVRDNLAAGLKVKVEYSNEVWNALFQQSGYARDMGARMWGTDLNGNGRVDLGTAEEAAGGGLMYYGYRSAQIAAIGKSVFGAGAEARLQNVISTQSGYLGLEYYVFQGVDNAALGSVSSLFDDYAITTYFGLDSTDQATIVSWARSGAAGIDAAFAGLETSLTDNIRTYVYQQAVAARNGMALVAYEGGFGVTAYTFAQQDQAAVVAFFDALSDDPRMGELYTKMVADFAASGGSGIIPYVDTGVPSIWGNWGTLDSIYDESSPRYDALVVASRSAKAGRAGGTDQTQVNVRTTAASYALAASQLSLTYIGNGGFNGTGNDLANTIVGGNSFNLLYGGGGVDTLTGGARNDILDGGTGADLMTGGAGDDTYVVDDIGDRVVELSKGGIDEVRTTLAMYSLGANVENLTFTGTGAFTGMGNELDNIITAAGNPARLYGGYGNDVLNGSVGADYLNGGVGADIMTGGSGDDVYIVDNAGDRVIELADGGVDTVQTTLGTYGLGNHVEKLIYTGTGDFVAYGNAADNVITGGAGNDSLSGDAGNDTLTGGAGNDSFWGGAGADRMIGGLGDDRYDVDDAGDIVTEYAGQGTDIVYSSISYTLTDNVENLVLSGTAALKGNGNGLNNIIFGNAGDNVLYGDGGDDSLIAGDGDDTLMGGTGDDSLSGGNGNDQLFGGLGNDTLDGGGGDDVLTGGAGRDVLSGGAGADRYVFSAGHTA